MPLTGNKGSTETTLLKVLEESILPPALRHLHETAYGEMPVMMITPSYHIKGIYNRINTRLITPFVNGNSTVTNTNSMFNITGGTGIFNVSILNSRSQINYQAGVGALTRFSCLFDTPTVGYWQLAGIGAPGNGLFVGYNELDFVILRQFNGTGETRKLIINIAENTSATATITLNSIAYNISITNAGGSIEFTAYDLIDKFDFRAVGWNASVRGVEIEFQGRQAIPQNGTYSYSSTGASTGTFSLINSGVSPSFEFVKQENFNKDKVDGTGKSKLILNPQKGNIFEIRYKWLGFGSIDYFLVNDEKSILIHRINYSNKNIEPSLAHPILRSSFSVLSVGGTGSALTVKVGSFAGFIEGIETHLQNFWGMSNAKSILANTETNILVLKSKEIQNGVINESEIFINDLTFATDGTKSVIFRIYIEGVIGDGTTSDFPIFIPIDDNSISMMDTNSISITNGILVASLVLSKEDSLESETLKGLLLQQLETLTITAQSTGSSLISCSINFNENI